MIINKNYIKNILFFLFFLSQISIIISENEILNGVVETPEELNSKNKNYTNNGLKNKLSKKTVESKKKIIIKGEDKNNKIAANNNANNVDNSNLSRLITCNSTDKIYSLVNKFYGERKEMENLENIFYLDKKELELTKGVEFYGIKHKSVIKVKSVESNK